LQLSVIIPTLARCEAVVGALQSIARAGSACEIEVIVADNGVDRTLACRVEAEAAAARLPVRYVAVPAIGLHNGRHAGARAAGGEVLAFLDDDVVVAPGWPQAIADAFRDPAVALVGGPSVPAFDGPPPTWMEGLWQRTPEAGRYCGLLSLIELGSEVREVDPRMVWGLNFAIRRAVLEELRGFHPDGFPWQLRRFRGDGEVGLTEKVRERRLRSLYEPRAMVRHSIPTDRATVEYLLRRSTLQGISDSYAATRACGRVALPDRCGLGELMADGLREALWGMRSAGGDAMRGARTAVLRWRLRLAWRRGVAYHSLALAREPRLLDWVLRPDYWEAAIADYGGGP